MSHVTHMNESCHTYKSVMSHIWMSHVTHMNESWHTYGWVISHMNESCHTYEWIMSHIWMRHVMSHIWMRLVKCHDSFIRVSRDAFTCAHHLPSHDLTPSYAQHDTFIRVTWLIHVRTIRLIRVIWLNESSVNPKSTSNQSSKPCTVLQYPSKKWHDLFTYVLSGLYVWYDTFIRRWLDSFIRVRHDISICTTWLIHM